MVAVEVQSDVESVDHTGVCSWRMYVRDLDSNREIASFAPWILPESGTAKQSRSAPAVSRALQRSHCVDIQKGRLRTRLVIRGRLPGRGSQAGRSGQSHRRSPGRRTDGFRPLRRPLSGGVGSRSRLGRGRQGDGRLYSGAGCSTDGSRTGLSSAHGSTHRHQAPCPGAAVAESGPRSAELRPARRPTTGSVAGTCAPRNQARAVRGRGPLSSAAPGPVPGGGMAIPGSRPASPSVRTGRSTRCR